MQSSVQPNSVRALQQQHLVILCQTPGGRLVSGTGSTPSSLDSTDSGASQQGWSGTILGPIARTGQGPILGPMAKDGQGPILGPMARAGQGPVLGPMASNTAPHRHSPTLSGALRRSPTRLRRPPAPTLSVPASSVLSCMQAHIEHEHVPPALRIDIHNCTLLCAHAQTSKRGGWPI